MGLKVGGAAAGAFAVVGNVMVVIGIVTMTGAG